jgi:hypothetical protein
MNYFTPEWHRSDLDEHPGKKYREHIVSMLRRWPPPVRWLANSVSLHDGHIREFSWNLNEATLFLRLRCGDLQVGYFDLDLHYSGVLFSPLDWGSLLTLNANNGSNALYDEMDEEAGRFVHRILFIASRRVRSSHRYRASRQVRISRRGRVSRAKRKFRYYENAIRFQHLRLMRTPRENRFDVNRAI